MTTLKIKYFILKQGKPGEESGSKGEPSDAQ
jgi:hypothetical protein